MINARFRSALCIASLLAFATAICAAQPLKSYISYFDNQDQQILESPQISNRVVLHNLMNDIATSSYTPDIKEKMLVYAYERYRAAFRGVPQPSAVPHIFAPTATEKAVPIVPFSAPTVAPMHNYAPNLLLQNAQTLEDVGQQMMLLGSMMNVTQAAPRPKKVLVVNYRAPQPPEKAFDETVRIIAKEKYALRVADRSSGVIEAIKTACCDGTMYASLFISIRSTGNDASVNAIFARYPGSIGGGSPKKWAVTFEKDLRKVQPDLSAER